MIDSKCLSTLSDCVRSLGAFEQKVKRGFALWVAPRKERSKKHQIGKCNKRLLRCFRSFVSWAADDRRLSGFAKSRFASPCETRDRGRRD